MVDYNDFEDDEFVHKPRRGYADIGRPDSSRYLRNRFRSGWAKGEQLWEIDMNFNLAMMSWWTVRPIWRYRTPSAAWPVVNQNNVILRSGSHKDLNAVTASGGDPKYYIPFAGTYNYIFADRLVAAYLGDEWKAAFYAKRFPVEMEIYLFSNRPKAGAICAAYVATHQFRVGTVHGETFDRWSRVRASKDNVEVVFTKNGNTIGTSLYTIGGGHSGRIRWYGETVFNPGDTLGMRAPRPLKGLNLLAASILASALI